jgi:hypothetical protein
VLVSSHLLGDLEELADRVVFVDRGATVGEHALDQLPPGHALRPWRVRALDTPSLVAALERNAYDFEDPTPAGVDVLLATDEAAAALLAGLVRDGVPGRQLPAPRRGARGGLPLAHGDRAVTASGIATVARQEFRLRIRAGRWKALLTAFFLVLLVFTCCCAGAMSNLAPDELPYTGTVLFGGLALFVLGLALLVVPALARSPSTATASAARSRRCRSPGCPPARSCSASSSRRGARRWSSSP